VIGDVHGHAEKLKGLLKQLGYAKCNGAWRHSERTAIFIGDLIDRGPHQRGTVELVRAMVDAGNARIVLGNHEFNAVAWATPNPEVPGEYLRPRLGQRGIRNRRQHMKFLESVGEDSCVHREYVAWFRSIPLWLDLGELRLVHACWSAPDMDIVKPWLSADGSLTYALMVEASRKGSAEYQAIETVLKGPEIDLPEGYGYLDHDGHRRQRARLRWWDASARTLRLAAEIPGRATAFDGSTCPDLPDTPLGDSVHAPYCGDVPVLFGHYWRTGAHDVYTSKTACVDYSAGNGAPLVAYRWDAGDRILVPEKFVGFPVI
jgi:hypothetical protein